MPYTLSTCEMLPLKSVKTLINEYVCATVYNMAQCIQFNTLYLYLLQTVRSWLVNILHCVCIVSNGKSILRCTLKWDEIAFTTHAMLVWYSSSPFEGCGMADSRQRVFGLHVPLGAMPFQLYEKQNSTVEYASSLPLNAVEWQIHDNGSLVCMCPWVLCLSNCMGSRMHCFRCKFTFLKCGGMADSRQWVQCSFGSLRPGGLLLHEKVERLCTSWLLFRRWAWVSLLQLTSRLALSGPSHRM